MLNKINIIFIISLGLCNAHSLAMDTALVAPTATASVGAKQSAERNVYTASSLALLIRFVDVKNTKTLLANPETPISNDRENSDNLISAMIGATEQIDPRKDKKMIRMLLYFGFNPAFRAPGKTTAQETAHSYDALDKDYSKWMDDYKNIEKYCTEKEVVEFGTIKEIRMLRAREIENLKKYKKPNNLMLREIGGLKIKKRVKTPASATAASFSWPSTKDSKENNK